MGIAGLKGCFIRQATTSTFWSWKSLRYPGRWGFLNTFEFKSKTLSLAIELEADIWIVEGCDHIGDASTPEYTRGIMQRHKTVPLSAVPWRKYDVVISILPIIPDKIIERFPGILWCYYPLTHISKLVKRSWEKPYGKYDLFLNHASMGGELKGLPQAISFPFPTSPDIMRMLIQPTNEPAVFLDTRLVKKEPLWWFEKRCNLPIRCSPQPASSGRRILAGKFTKMREYLETLGSCKYFLASKKRSSIGQAALEAAALGLIVISGPGVYPSVLCHPRCLTAPNNPRQGLNVIKKIEGDADLQKEILAHQDAILWTRFWKEPLGLLHDALKMKRR